MIRSADCSSCGPRYALLGNIQADAKGHASASLQRPKLTVADVIGRSVVVYNDADDTSSSKEAQMRAACAVVARSAGVVQNAKRICACDGTTIWESKAP